MSKKKRKKAAATEDLFLEEWDEKPKKRKKKKKRGTPEAVLAVNLLLCLGIAALLAMSGLLIRQHNSFAEMKRVVEAQTFYDGTSVEGINVSGKTLDAAMDYWKNRVEPKYSQRRVSVAGVGDVTAEELGYQSDYAAALYSAWSAGRRG